MSLAEELAVALEPHVPDEDGKGCSHVLFVDCAAAILADPAFREALTAAVIAAFQEVQPGVYGTDWPFDDPDDFTFVNPTEHARAIIAHLLPEAEK